MNNPLHTSKFKRSIVFVISFVILAACSPAIHTSIPSATPNVATTPTATPAVSNTGLASNSGVDAKVDALLAQMTLDEKIGQMTQALSSAMTPQDLNTYFIGSVLSGGSDYPTPNTPQAWADQFDSLQQVALSTRLAIPILYGIDSVHGFSHTVGTTVFPHNIGLGATRDPDLVKQVGRITALEMAGTGIRWTFSPCLCVDRSERWGRTYECFGEDPALISQMAVIIQGYQGDDLSQPTSILATAKHYVCLSYTSPSPRDCS